MPNARARAVCALCLQAGLHVHPRAPRHCSISEQQSVCVNAVADPRGSRSLGLPPFLIHQLLLFCMKGNHHFHLDDLKVNPWYYPPPPITSSSSIIIHTSVMEGVIPVKSVQRSSIFPLSLSAGLPSTEPPLPAESRRIRAAEADGK